MHAITASKVIITAAVPQVFTRPRNAGWGFDGDMGANLRSNLTLYGRRLLRALFRIQGVTYIATRDGISHGGTGHALHTFEITVDWSLATPEINILADIANVIQLTE